MPGLNICQFRHTLKSCDKKKVLLRSLKRAWGPVEPERAAAKIQHMAIARQTFPEPGRHVALHILSILLGDNNSRFPQNAEMLGNIVLGQVEEVADFADRHRLFQQRLNNAPAVFIRQRLEHADTTIGSDFVRRHGVTR